MESHQLWGRPSDPLRIPRLWQPPSLLDGRVQSYSPSVFIVFAGALVDQLSIFWMVYTIFWMVYTILYPQKWFYDGLYPSH